MFDPPPILQGRYHLQQRIGQGGMGAVYLAADKTLNREVAIKFLARERLHSPESSERFLREARIVARLNHPNIMTLFDLGREDQWHYLVLEYLKGSNLLEIIRQRGALPADEAIPIIAAALDGLAYAHQHNVIHRDIKPENILLTDSGIVKIADFGVALSGHEVRLTEVGSMVGTVMYMSPEQVRGDPLDARSDLYAVGAVFYELLIGQAPYPNADTITLISQILYGGFIPPRTINNQIPTPIETIILKLLEKDPTERYHSAEETLDALKQAAATSSGKRATTGQTLLERLSSATHPRPADPKSPDLYTELLIAAAIEDTNEQIEAERRRIAALLESSLVDSLNLMLSQVNIYEQTLGNHPPARMAISVLSTLTKQLLQQARDLGAGLHPAILESLGLEPALEALANQEIRARGVHIHLMLERMTERLNHRLEWALYRAAQDTLSRLIQQGGATQITMRLQRHDDHLRFSINSSGQLSGADSLQHLRQRIQALGGTIEFLPAGVMIEFYLQPPVELTEREHEVLLLLVDGLGNKQIAAALGISQRTVKFHLDNLYSKLGVNTRTEAAIYALRHGLLR